MRGLFNSAAFPGAFGVASHDVTLHQLDVIGARLVTRVLLVARHYRHVRPSICGGEEGEVEYCRRFFAA
jgi:hypothetical protein